ncbi:MAG: helix-turn-helix transcriptional regulator [Alphaproteobacteria bacterium]
MCELISKKGCASLLNISPRTLEEWIRAGSAPPHYRIGMRLKFKKSEVKDWIEKRKIQQKGKDNA